MNEVKTPRTASIFKALFDPSVRGSLSLVQRLETLEDLSETEVKLTKILKHKLTSAKVLRQKLAFYYDRFIEKSEFIMIARSLCPMLLAVAAWIKTLTHFLFLTTAIKKGRFQCY